ncbi:MAG: sulfite exporter TauE/SafE family protein [Bacteroidales bacterium]
MNDVVIVIIIGLLAGLLGGTLGVGGGILVIPALVMLLGFSQHEAQGTSIAFMIPPISLLAAYNYWKNGYVNIKYASIIAACFFVGSYFGSQIAISIPETTMKRVFGGLMLIASLKFIFAK